jgi:hypothetical protein
VGRQRLCHPQRLCRWEWTNFFKIGLFRSG